MCLRLLTDKKPASREASPVNNANAFFVQSRFLRARRKHAHDYTTLMPSTGMAILSIHFKPAAPLYISGLFFDSISQNLARFLLGRDRFGRQYSA